MLSKVFDINYPKLFKLTIKNFKRKRKDNLAVFEPKHLRGCYDETNAMSLSQTATFNIKCLKWDLKDSPYVWT